MNESKAEGFLDKTKGKIKQAVGETFGDDKMANSGAADQVKGSAKETWGNVKDSAHDLGHSNTATTTETHAENTGNNARSSVTNAAEDMKDSVKRGLNNLERKAND